MRRDGHLRVVARGFEFVVALSERGVQLIGPLEAGAQHRRANAMNRATGRIEHQQSLRGKGL